MVPSSAVLTRQPTCVICSRSGRYVADDANTHAACTNDSVVGIVTQTTRASATTLQNVNMTREIGDVSMRSTDSVGETVEFDVARNNGPVVEPQRGAPSRGIGLVQISNKLTIIQVQTAVSLILK